VTVRIEVNGDVADADAAWSAASSFGHFTAMQVRRRATRGLDLHLRRLEAANRELFDSGLDRDEVRELVAHALGETEDASVRVYLIEFAHESEPATVVTVREPGGIESPQRLRSVDYQRPSAHLKHLATEQGYHTRLARRDGYDDALLTAGLDVVSEAATANIGFFDVDDVVWPDAPLLHGITMQLLEAALRERGVRVRRTSVRMSDLPRFDGAFLSNARGIAAVSAIDDLFLPEAEDRITMLLEAYAAIPWDPIFRIEATTPATARRAPRSA
jgi:branched-subunit amino acid aminotransferase/4-amino-4-deoxychorismate lyase